MKPSTLLQPQLMDAISRDTGVALRRCGPSERVIALVTDLSESRINQITSQGDHTGAPQRAAVMIHRLAAHPATDARPLLARFGTIAAAARAPTNPDQIQAQVLEAMERDLEAQQRRTAALHRFMVTWSLEDALALGKAMATQLATGMRFAGLVRAYVRAFQ